MEQKRPTPEDRRKQRSERMREMYRKRRERIEAMKKKQAEKES